MTTPKTEEASMSGRHWGSMTVAEYRAKVIQECIDALPKERHDSGPLGLIGAMGDVAIEKCRKSLESLLPTKPNKAEELAKGLLKAWYGEEWEDQHHDDKQGPLRAARWLITNNHVKEG